MQAGFMPGQTISVATLSAMEIAEILRALNDFRRHAPYDPKRIEFLESLFVAITDKLTKEESEEFKKHIIDLREAYRDGQRTGNADTLNKYCQKFTSVEIIIRQQIGTMKLT